MATEIPLDITINSNDEFVPDPDPVELVLGDTLVISVPAGGCTICVKPTINDKSSFDLTGTTKVPIPNTVQNYEYCITTLNGTCKPDDKKRDGGHSIHVSSGV
jgi:hypothetical protein